MSRGIFQYAQDLINDSSKSINTTYSSNKIEELLGNMQLTFHKTTDVLTEKVIGNVQTINIADITTNISDLKIGHIIFDTSEILGRIISIDNIVNQVDVEILHANLSSGGCIEIKGCLNTAPTVFNAGDKYFNTTTSLLYTANASGWDTGSTPESEILYINTDNNKLYAYVNGIFDVYGGNDYQISTKVDNALKEITGSAISSEDGLYVKDLELELAKLNWAQKTVNEVGEFELLDAPITFNLNPAATQGTSISTDIYRDIILLDDITNYDYIDISIRNSSATRKFITQTHRIKVDEIVFNNSNTLDLTDGSMFPIMYDITSTDDSQGEYTMSLQIWFKDSKTLYLFRGYTPYAQDYTGLELTSVMGKKEKSIIIDPVEYVNTTQGIEDTPVGHIINITGRTVPKHYLACDGSMYNITDYPYLAEHFKSEFGKYNVFGGDGVTTFAVPNLEEGTMVDPGLITDYATDGAAFTNLGNYSGHNYNNVFNYNNTKTWFSDTSPDELSLSNKPHIGYKFNSPKCVKKMLLTNMSYTSIWRCIDYDIEGSLDGANWVNLYSGTLQGDSNEHEITLNNSLFYTYYRLVFTSVLSAGSNYNWGIGKIKFLGYDTDSNQVIKYEPTYFMNIGDITYEYGCEKILGCFDTAPSSFLKGDKYFNTIDNLMYEADTSTTWGVGQNPNADVIYLNLDDKKIYNFNNGVFEVFGGSSSISSATISKQPNNAIEQKADGIYVYDYASMIAKIQDKRFSGLDKGYYFITGKMSDTTKTWNAGYSLISFIKNSLGTGNYIENSDLAVSTNGYISLTEGAWSLSAGTINESTNAIKYVWKDSDGNVLGNQGFVPSGTDGNTNIDANALVTVNKGEVLNVAPIRLDTNGAVEQLYSFVSVQRVGTADVDQIGYLSPNGNLEEVPVGNVIDYMGTKTPNHYLLCDGATYNIEDYPELATMIKNNFGRFNHFGGDGVTTFAVPAYSKPEWTSLKMTAANSVSSVKAVKDSITITATSVYNNNYPVWKAFDGVISTITDNVYHSASPDNNCTLTIDFGKQVMLDGFRIHTRANYLYQIPGQFDMLGSNDNGVTWANIKSFTVATPATEGWVEYLFDNTQSYQIYKLQNMKTTAGDPYVSINEMEFKVVDALKYIKYETTHKVLFGDQTTYKVTTPITYNLVSNSMVWAEFDRANAEDDISMLGTSSYGQGDVFKAPIDGYYHTTIMAPEYADIKGLTYHATYIYLNGVVVGGSDRTDNSTNIRVPINESFTLKLKAGDEINLGVFIHATDTNPVVRQGTATFCLMNVLNENRTADLMNKPNTWVAGQEYDFGDGLYGYRFQAATWIVSSSGGIEVIPASIGAKNIVDWGGSITHTNGNRWALPAAMKEAWYEVYRQGTTTTTPYILQLTGTMASGTAKDLDVWFKYTK